MASSSAATLAAACCLHCEELPKGLAVIGDAILGRHRCRSCVRAGLLRLEQVEKENSDLATEDGPLRVMFIMDRRSWESESDGKVIPI